MICININKALQNAEQLKEKRKSSKVFLQSLRILKPEKRNIFRKIIFLMIEVVVGIIMSKQVNTILLTKDIFQLLITIIIALIAIVFTGYAFFQALINDKLLVALLSVDDERGNLYGTNKYFAEVMIFQIGCLLLDIFIAIFMIVLPQEWCLFENNITNEFIATVLLTIVLYSNIEGIWEMKSFVFNVFQLFNLHAYARINTIKDNEKREEGND